MEGIEISSRFGLPPNSRDYCGRRTFAPAFAAYLKNKSAANRAALESEIGKFTAHFAYLNLIAKANGLRPFDWRVAEALWIGNGLLGNVGRKDLQAVILGQFCGKGMLAPKKAVLLAEKMPEGFVPHHSFHVLYLHTISGVIEPSVANADLCRVSWGKVKRIDGKHAVLESQKLVKKNGKLALVPFRKTVSMVCAGMILVPNLKVGDIVASHWDVAVMGLSKTQAAQLEKTTRQNIAAANRAPG